MDIGKQLTMNEVAKALRVHERTVERWIKRGYIKALKLGKGRTALLRIPEKEFELFLKKSLVKNQ